MAVKSRLTIGRAERIDFVEQGIQNVPARVDTGAKTSSVWASNISIDDKGLSFKLFSPKSPHYTGQTITTKSYTKRVIASSNGQSESRYVVRLLIAIKDRKVRASFSLANRSRQVYPVLVGRNVLAGKFVVDVKKGQPLLDVEKRRSAKLQSAINQREQS